MPKRSRFVPGDHNVICDRTGFKIKASESRKEWNGRIVRKQSFEERHPQDKIRGRADRQAVKDPRPRPANVFLSDNEVVASDL